MTPSEERQYLSELCLEAARWRVDHDDPCCALELEIRDRLRRLNGIETVDENGEVQGEVEVSPVFTEDDYKALEAAKLNEHLASPEKVDDARKQWERSKVRCSENGRLVWHPRSECQKVPRDNSKGGPAWKWQWMGPNSPTVEENLPTKTEQEEAMWEEHERS